MERVDDPSPERRQQLIGRDKDWAALSAALDSVRNGLSRVVFVEGEAGVGKTRLTHELIMRAYEDGFAVVSGRSEELERMRPYGGIAHALEGSGDLATAGKKMRRLLRPDASDPQRQPPGEQVLIDAFVELVEELALARPTCVVLEDLHWADPGTISGIRAVARRLSYLPILVLGTYRPHPRPPELSRLLDVSTREGAVELILRPLDEPSVIALIEATVGASVGPRLRKIILSAAGNPLYATEIARTLSEDGDLNIHDGVAEVVTVELPPTLRLTILRRISFLPAATLETLRFAAVLGSSFGLEELVAFTAAPLSDVADQLRPAFEAKIIEEGSGGVGFRHDLIQEAIYQDVPPSLRASMHVDAARALRAHGVPPVRVAEHIIRGLEVGLPELFEEAVALAYDLRFRAPLLSVALYEKALELPGISEDRRSRARADVIPPLILSRRVDEGERLAKEVMATLQDPSAGAYLLCHVLEGGKMHAGRALECISVLEALANDPRIAGLPHRLAVTMLAIAYLRIGDGFVAAEFGPELIAESRDDGNDPLLTAGLVLLAMAKVCEGRVAEAVPLAEEAGEVAVRTPSPVTVAFAGVALARLEADRLADALDASRRGRDHLRTGDRSSLAPHHSIESFICFLAGDWTYAIAEAATASELLEEGVGASDLAFGAWVSLGQILLRRGQVDEALRELGKADRFISERGPQWGMGLIAWTKAQCLYASGSPRQAWDMFVDAWDSTASARYFCTRPLFADFVRLALEVGERDRAEVVAAEAKEGGRRAPEVATAVAVGLQCRGLVNDDPEALLAAVEAYQRSPRIVEHSRVCEDAAAALVRRGKADEARRLFTEALSFYESVGASHDARRVSAAMRQAGLRRGSRERRGRPKSGWEALTDAELQVARLTIQGLTNPQIAERLFVSRNTVQTHLSHIFGKLGISTRVALAGIAAGKVDSATGLV